MNQVFASGLNSSIFLCMSGVAGTLGIWGWLMWWRLHSANQHPPTHNLDDLLTQEQLRSNLIIESITDGVIVTGADGRISLMNKAAADLTGWPLEDVIGLAVETVLPLYAETADEGHGELNLFPTVLHDNQHIGQIVQLKDHKNIRKIVSITIAPINVDKEENVDGAVAVLRDVSESRAEERRRADFISTASHEMRTPVAALEGYLALTLNPKVARIDDKARQYLEKAHASTKHLGKLFQDLLTSSRAEDGRLEYHPAVVEMGNYLEQVMDLLKVVAKKHNIPTEFLLGGSTTDKPVVHGGTVVRPLYYVHIDPDRFHEVLTNLFDNAIKYTKSGKITVGLTGNEHLVQLFIRDTGVGIPAADLPHLFQKFYRVDSSTTRVVGGTGLGLFICRKIVELCHGKIWVTSVVGQGSTFYINLPRLNNQQAEELQKGSSSTGQAVSQSPLHKMIT